MVGDAARLALHRSARELLGDAEGDAPMSLLPRTITAVAPRWGLALLEAGVAASSDGSVAGMCATVLARTDRAHGRSGA